MGMSSQRKSAGASQRYLLAEPNWLECARNSVCPVGAASQGPHDLEPRRNASRHLTRPLCGLLASRTGRRASMLVFKGIGIVFLLLRCYDFRLVGSPVPRRPTPRRSPYPDGDGFLHSEAAGSLTPVPRERSKRKVEIGITDYAPGPAPPGPTSPVGKDVDAIVTTRGGKVKVR